MSQYILSCESDEAGSFYVGPFLREQSALNMLERMERTDIQVGIEELRPTSDTDRWLRRIELENG